MALFGSCASATFHTRICVSRSAASDIAVELLTMLEAVGAAGSNAPSLRAPSQPPAATIVAATNIEVRRPGIFIELLPRSLEVGTCCREIPNARSNVVGCHAGNNRLSRIERIPEYR